MNSGAVASGVGLDGANGWMLHQQGFWNSVSRMSNDVIEGLENMPDALVDFGG